MDIDSFIDRFIVFLSVNRGLSDNTIQGYARDLSEFARFFENKSLSKENIFEFVEKNILGKYQPATINRKLSSIRAFVKFISRSEDVDFSPKDIKNVKHKRIPPKYISFDDISGAFSSDRDGLIILLMYASGLRVSELANLRISDIFFDSGFLKIKGKGSKERIVPIDFNTLKMLDEYIKNGRQRYIKEKSSDFLFLSNRGYKLTRQAIWKIVKKKFLSIGINIHPHSLRHLFATHMIENGASLRVVQDMLGHESITTTQIYTDISDVALEKEFHKLEILE